MIGNAFRAGVFRLPGVLLLFAFKFSQELRMLHKALVLVFAVASIASCISCGKTANHYVYATLPAANQLLAYREDPNSGVLIEIAGSPYPVGDGAHSVVLHPSGKFLYVSNPGQLEDDISLFLIATDGSLTEVTPRTSIGPNASQPQLLAIDPAGAFLYVMNTGSNNISVFSIDSSSGTLAQVANSPVQIGLPPLNMQLTPSGNYLYVTTGGNPDGFIFGYSVSAGVLTPLPFPNPISSDGINPNGLAIDPSGSFLYAANTSSPSISIFAIGASGTPPGSLSPVTGSPLADTYAAPIALTLDPKGTVLYVANQGSNNVAVYSISSSTGLPTVLTSSTNTGAFFTEGSPSFLVTDPSGKYLLVGNQGSSAGIQAFSVGSDSLTAIHTYPVGNTPTSIVVLK
jgi:6-phosphogluconolactonase (cycloisomerase 2 family)